MFMAPAFNNDDIVFEKGEPKWFQSSEIAKRGFCENCGSALFFKFEGIDAMDVLIGAFDDPDVFSPRDHLFMKSKLHWIGVDESLPLYESDRSKKPMNSKD